VPRKPRPIKHIGRKRRLAGWTLLTLGAILVVVWATSAFTTPRIGSRTTKAAVHRGVLYAFVSNRDYYAPSLHGGRIVLVSDGVWDDIEKDPPGLDLWRGAPTLSTRVVSVSRGALIPWCYNSSIILPLWQVWSACAAVGILLLWIARRAKMRCRQGHCSGCGYSLAGLDGPAHCPECGKPKP
jgi:hypothetical protein